MNFGFDAQRILDFDLETRPLGWYAGDMVHKEVTAIAWAWIRSDGSTDRFDVDCYQLTHRTSSMRRMLKAFAKAYAEADIVCGHWIRGYDLPVLQMAMIDNELPLLGEKLTQDTKNALIKFQGVSKSQQNLASLLGIPSPKIVMSQQDWREANRLTKTGLKLVRERVIADVVQNIEMRQVLLDQGLLNPPKLWLPSTSISGDYVP